VVTTEQQWLIEWPLVYANWFDSKFQGKETWSMDLPVRQLAISRLESRQLGQEDPIAKFRSDHQNGRNIFAETRTQGRASGPERSIAVEPSRTGPENHDNRLEGDEQIKALFRIPSEWTHGDLFSTA
jgi:hypothetical protein